MSRYVACHRPHARADHHVRMAGSAPCYPRSACRRGLVEHFHRAREEPATPLERAEARVRAILGGSRFLILSAEEPGGAHLSAAANRQRTKELADDLSASGARFYPSTGTYVYTEGPHKGETSHEHSFLVEDVSRGLALELARRYGQESFVHGHELVSSRTGRSIVRFDKKHDAFGDVALETNPISRLRIAGQEVVFALRE